MSYTQLPEEWIAKNIHNPQTNNRDKFLEESTHYFFSTITIYLNEKN